MACYTHSSKHPGNTFRKHPDLSFTCNASIPTKMTHKSQHSRPLHARDKKADSTTLALVRHEPFSSTPQHFAFRAQWLPQITLKWALANAS